MLGAQLLYRLGSPPLSGLSELNLHTQTPARTGNLVGIGRLQPGFQRQILCLLIVLFPYFVEPPEGRKFPTALCLHDLNPLQPVELTKETLDQYISVPSSSGSVLQPVLSLGHWPFALCKFQSLFSVVQ